MQRGTRRQQKLTAHVRPAGVMWAFARDTTSQRGRRDCRRSPLHHHRPLTAAAVPLPPRSPHAVSAAPSSPCLRRVSSAPMARSNQEPP